MKRHATSYITWEMQIKSTMRYHHTLIRMVKIQKSDNIKFWQGCGATGPLIPCWSECKLAQPLWKTAWQFLRSQTYFHRTI